MLHLERARHSLHGFPRRVGSREDAFAQLVDQLTLDDRASTDVGAKGLASLGHLLVQCEEPFEGGTILDGAHPHLDSSRHVSGQR